VALAFSQSGRSPDLVEPMQRLRAGGATTVAFVNDAASPLAAAAEHPLPLHAGAERSVAATKSFIAQLVAGAAPAGRVAGRCRPGRRLQALPDALAQAAAQDWPPASSRSLRRGSSTSSAAARAWRWRRSLRSSSRRPAACRPRRFSGAELAHGPLALVQPGWPLLVLAPRGPAQAGLVALARQQRARGVVGRVGLEPTTKGL
jgi:glutamine---fructose-6-phosphate transaminase (isomerizing)